ncbi:MAG TPA: HAD-IIA family hydrolase [Mycobacteriales bacterium]|nr:HAD-IIA family hydrolase [Mycobacteriales bacterium]
MTAELEGAPALSEAYDVALLDLDGVVYLGKDPAPYAVDSLAAAREAGMRLAFVTNNASRSPADVVAQLDALGIAVDVEEVVTGAQAAAGLLAQRLSRGDAVLVTGTAALAAEIEAVGLRVVTSADDHPKAVVMGYDPTIDYPRLAEAAVAIRRGALFVASNLDATLPTPRGPLPGMGSLAALVTTATGQQPVVAGKPERPLFDQSVERTRASKPIVVGDRVDTDIEGANRAGLQSLLVLTGVTDVLAAATAPAEQRPTFVSQDLRGLNQPHHAAREGRCGTAVAEYDEPTRRIVVRDPGDDPSETLAAMITAGWAATDQGLAVEGVEDPGRRM